MSSTLFGLLFLVLVCLMLNLVYAFLFIFSFNGIRNFYEKVLIEGNSLPEFVTLVGALIFSPTYIVANYVYNFHWPFARLLMVTYTLFLYFLIYLGLQLFSKF